MNNKVFVTSDLHFFHTNVIKYEDRPFTSTEDMNEKMIKNWNSVVGGCNKIFVLGDFSFANKEKTKSIVDRLMGYKILILGNHDRRHPVGWWRDAGFDEVCKYPIIYCNDYILSHEPVNAVKLDKFKNVHGHVHSKSLESDRYINVSIETNNYVPILFDDILKGNL